MTGCSRSMLQLKTPCHTAPGHGYGNYKHQKKYKFLIWLICHEVVPTMGLLHHRNMANAATCSHCGEDNETLLHCFRDCRFSKEVWHEIGFTDTHFFTEQNAHSWVNTAATGPISTCFLAALWWVWRHRNLMCLNNETWSLFRIINNINNSTDAIIKSFQNNESVAQQDRFVRWNCHNHSCTILNVDGSCLGSPVRAGFGGIIQNCHGFYLAGFSGHISNSDDILLAELTAIYHGLQVAIDMGIDELVCYSDSLLSINLITINTPMFHIYAVLLQDIKDLLANRNFTLHHTLREGNYCADYLAKLGTSSKDVFTIHPSPPVDLLTLIKNDASGILYSRA